MPQVKSSMFFLKSGCLLPFLIAFNLLFGRIFFKTSHWLLIEIILILLFIANLFILTRKIFSAASAHPRDNARIIDTEAKVIEEDSKIN